jgi:hypothetical protein
MHRISSSDNLLPLVDENLYYKGVDKHAVETARLSQMHGFDTLSIKSASMTDPTTSAENARSQASSKPAQPPYLFSSGDSLLALTKRHNVCTETAGFHLGFY